MDSEIKAREEHLALLKVARAKYPDLYFSSIPGQDERIPTSKAALADCDQIMLGADANGQVYAIPYVKVGGPDESIAVVGEVSFHVGYVLAWSAIDRLRKETPEAYRALVAAAKVL
jgi:hypothetical protein